MHKIGKVEEEKTQDGNLNLTSMMMPDEVAFNSVMGDAPSKLSKKDKRLAKIQKQKEASKKVEDSEENIEDEDEEKMAEDESDGDIGEVLEDKAGSGDPLTCIYAFKHLVTSTLEDN